MNFIFNVLLILWNEFHFDSEWEWSFLLHTFIEMQTKRIKNTTQALV